MHRKSRNGHNGNDHAESTGRHEVLGSIVAGAYPDGTEAIPAAAATTAGDVDEASSMGGDDRHLQNQKQPRCVNCLPFFSSSSGLYPFPRVYCCCDDLCCSLVQ